MSSPPMLLITTLAEYQTVFWAAVGRELRTRGRAVAFVSFDDRSTEMLAADGFEVFSLDERERAIVADEAAVRAAEAEYRMGNLNHWFAHERFAFGVRDTQALQSKLLGCLSLARRARESVRARDPRARMVQELGGFVSVVASFFAARACGMPHWYVEPSFFRGRMFFLRDSFAALKLDPALDGPVSPEVRDYLDRTLQTQAIVIPKKDAHQYASAFRKIINVRNAKRLVQKVVDKHVHGKRQEFGHIGQYVSTHVRMLLDSRRLSGAYTPLGELGRFVYYPLHVPGDMALTLRSPQFLDQIAFVDYLARTVPRTHRVAIKEHPAMVGAIDARRVLGLLERYDTVALLPPTTNNYDVLRRADAVVTVNSKSGAEAALLGKRVLVMGDAFYRDSPLVEAVDSLDALESAVARAVAGADAPAHGRDAIERYFERVWRHTMPGELYVPQQDNVRTFTDSMLAATGG